MGAVNDVTVLLRDWRAGDARALDRLLPLVYDTLRGMASARLRATPSGVTLQPTAVVHEALLRMLGPGQGWSDRAHFMAVAALKMRAVLVDHARERAADKRGGGAAHLTLSHADGAAAPGFEVDVDLDVLALHRALDALAALDARAARAIEMTYFGGMGREEIAEVLGVSVPTVDRDLRFARAWLNKALS